MKRNNTVVKAIQSLLVAFLAAGCFSPCAVTGDSNTPALRNGSYYADSAWLFGIPGAMSFDDSGWMYADRLGFFKGDYPWIYVEGSEWWYTSPDGWWYPYSMRHGTPANQSISADKWGEIEGKVSASMAKYQIPGIAYAVKFAGQDPIVRALGVRDVASGEALRPTDRFRIGSTSKSFMGGAILQLIANGSIGIDHPVGMYLPDNVLTGYDREAITIRMLLQHTSGINNYTNVIDEWNVPYIFERDRVWRMEELVAMVDANVNREEPWLGKLFEPGSSWSYSNTNTVLLGIILERVSGLAVSDYLNRKVIPAAGLTQTYSPNPGESEIRGEHSRGYMDWQDFTGADFVPAGLSDVTVYDPTGVGPAGAVVSTVGDLTRWAEALAFNRSLIPSEIQQLHVNTHGFIATSLNLPSVSCGFHLIKELDQMHASAVPNIAHRGQISGYDTVMMYLTEVDCAIVMVCNRTLPMQGDHVISGLEVGVYEMINILFPEMVAKWREPFLGSAPMDQLSVHSNESPSTRSESAPFRAFPMSEY